VTGPTESLGIAQSSPTRDEQDGDPARIEGEALNLVGNASEVLEAAYVWTFSDDCLEWEDNAERVIGVTSRDRIGTNKAYTQLIAPEHQATRLEAITGGQGQSAGSNSSGSSYRVRYRIKTGGVREAAKRWVEESGRCWFGPNGRPATARGRIKLIDTGDTESLRLLVGADIDELTGQLNRIRLIEALGTFVRRSAETKSPAAFVMLSVNNLTAINEQFGYDVGDEVLAATAATVKSRLRAGDVIGRYSSNKFGIIFADCGEGAMRAAAERLMRAVADSVIKTSVCQLTSTISVGGVVLPDHATAAPQALSHALKALDWAKTKRPGNFHCYEPNGTHETNRQRNIMLVEEIMAAHEQDRLLLALQPIIDARTREVSLYECLLRLRKINGEIVSAGQFIAVAEQLGFSRILDLRTLELAVEILRKHPAIRLSVNVSSHTATDHDWLVALHRMTAGRRQMTERLTIEITETAAIEDLDQSINFVDTLKELGCRVAIDDFGAGYTSFRNLKLLNVDMVKIDGSFVKDLVASSTDHIFVKTLTDLATRLGMETVAEWVGNEEAAILVRDVGITYMQGYYLGEPIISTEFQYVGQSSRPEAG